MCAWVCPCMQGPWTNSRSVGIDIEGGKGTLSEVPPEEEFLVV